MKKEAFSIGESLNEIWDNLTKSVLRKDRYRLLNQLKKNQKKPDKLFEIIKESEILCQQFQQRSTSIPTVRLDQSLPVNQEQERITQAITDHQIIVIAGETGSGKTTQIPKLCLQAGLGKYGMIGCTQPRRIAAKSVAYRVAEELNTSLGKGVGYQVRFDERYDANGWIKFMTDGILLQQTQVDRWLNEYDVIIVDEAHERSLNIDFLLGFLKQLCNKRKDLKLVITSATIDTDKFSQHFDNAPVIEVSGRSYPVEIKYRDFTEKKLDMDQSIVNVLDEVYKHSDSGDVLIFLPGEREIKSATDVLKKKRFPNTEILPLYARLTGDQQMKIFQTSTQRRIVLSTNVAETSLTVPGIRYVIDSGVARISRYSPRSKIQGLQIEPIAQDSANQRAGRCGRVMDGVCYRLYSEADFESRAEHTDPEILRTSLASVILQTMNLRLGKFETFPFIDKPDQKMVADGYQLLWEIQAIDEQRKLTNIGKQISRFPIDVQLARILIQASQFQCLSEILIIVAALSIQDVRERPLEWAKAADKSHQQFADEYSDFMSYLNIWNTLNEERKIKKNKVFKKWCRENFISIKRYMEWRDIHRQLSGLTKKLSLIKNKESASYQSIHKALLSGFISHIGHLVNSYEYEAPRNRRFQIFPGSYLFNSQPAWVMAAAIVHTTQVFARTVASIRPDWITEVGSHLINRYHYGPYWSKKQGSVMGYQRTKLLGLTILEKQPIHYGPKDPTLSRELFIEQALIRRQLNTSMKFYRHNNQLIDGVLAEEDRQRKKDLLVDDRRLFDMYDAVVAHGVYSENQLRSWAKIHGEQALNFKREDLYQTSLDEPLQARFPEHLFIRQLSLPLTYDFSPGEPTDGVTVSLDITWLNALNENDFEFLVPGLVIEKIETLIKGLPKSFRRSLIPISECANEIVDGLQTDKCFYSQVAQVISHKSGMPMTADQLRLIDMPDHLKMRFELFDTAGVIIATNRNFEKLSRQYGEQANQSFQQTASQYYQMNGARDWVFENISSVVYLDNGVAAYPALFDEGETVGLQVFETEKQAQQEHVSGVRKLVYLKYPKLVKQAKKQDISLRMTYIWEQVSPHTGLLSVLADALIRKSIKAFLPIQNQSEFDALCDELKCNLYQQVFQWSSTLKPILEEWYVIWQKIEEHVDILAEESYQDMINQLDFLIYEGVYDHVQLSQLKHYPRYLKGLAMRVETALHSPQKEADKLAELESISVDFYNHCASCEYDDHAQSYLMLLEEYRISLFAQQLGTREKVSKKRLASALKELKTA